jgi:hypothetical protein
MELPNDVVKIIREYSSPKYPYWKAGSYIYKQLKLMNINLLDQLHYWIIIKEFSYCPNNYLRIEYELLKHNTRYKNFVNGLLWNGNDWIGSTSGYWQPAFGPKIPRPICFPVLIGNTKQMLRDARNGKKMRSKFSNFTTKTDIEWHISYEIQHHKEMKLRFPDRLFGYY